MAAIPSNFKQNEPTLKRPFYLFQSITKIKRKTIPTSGYIVHKNHTPQFNCLLLKQLLYCYVLTILITAWVHQTI